MKAEVWGVDAFTSTAFRGNPAAVVRLGGPAAATWMQAVAAEFNLSETAFVHPVADGWALRWFTPTTEVALCGHATLAAAHVLLELEGNAGALRFRTRENGFLVCEGVSEGRIRMNFPAVPARSVPRPDGMAAALAGTIQLGCRYLVGFLGFKR
jgi:PhzF family phenazine biosynthesis protein